MQNPGNQGNQGQPSGQGQHSGQGQQGGQLGQKWANANFVERAEMAFMQYAILGKAQQGEVTKENLQQTFKGSLQMSGNHFDHCIQQLVQDGHLKESGNKYTVTDDGREDVQKLQNIVLELPNVVKQGGQGQQQRPTQQTTAGGGSTTGGTQGGNVGTTGNVGQQNMGQPKGGPGSSSR